MWCGEGWEGVRVGRKWSVCLRCLVQLFTLRCPALLWRFWLLLPQGMGAASSTCRACGPRPKSCTATGRRHVPPLQLLLHCCCCCCRYFCACRVASIAPLLCLCCLQWVLLKGGHLQEQQQQQQQEGEERMVADVLFDGKNMIELREPYIRYTGGQAGQCWSIAVCVCVEGRDALHPIVPPHPHLIAPP